MTKGDKRFCNNGKTFPLGLTANILYVPLFPLAMGVKAEGGRACLTSELVVVAEPSGAGVGGRLSISKPSVSIASSSTVAPVFVVPFTFPFDADVGSSEEIEEVRSSKKR